MRQFSLEEYLANPSRKVVTRDERNARIVCTDKKGRYPVVALIERKDNEDDVLTFTKDGIWVDLVVESINDLFFAPEKHERWVNIYRDATIGEIPFYKYIYPSEEEAKRNSGPGVIATTKIEWEE